MGFIYIFKYYMKIYIVFHKNIYPENYENLTENEKEKLIFYGVKEKPTNTKDMKIIYENEMMVYNPKLQHNRYNEGSALYHIYKNHIALFTDYIGFFQYDMKFESNAIQNIQNTINENPKKAFIFYIDFFQWGFVGGQSTITRNNKNHDLESGLKNYNRTFGTNYKPEDLMITKMLMCNSFVIPSHIFQKMMKWMQSYFRDKIDIDIKDTLENRSFNPGHMIEALTGMFLALEVAQGNAVYERILVEHERIA
jgi:hypothetical protein